MSDNHKYYYIKLKDNYFDQDNIKILESMKNGYIYSLVLIKMYLRASKYDGRLMMTQTIPYEPNNLDVLASVLGHDVDHVKEAIRIGTKLDLITIVDGKEIWLTEIQNFIGQSSTEADRVRKYRAKIAQTETLKIAEEVDSVQMYDKSTPEIELEKELKIKIDKELEKDKKKSTTKRFKKPTAEEVETYARDIGFNVDAQHFIDYYESKGWLVGKTPMKDWKATLRNWKRNHKQQNNQTNDEYKGAIF
jgi:predicted phage replisome organizer